jgi:hypothetical protein
MGGGNAAGGVIVGVVVQRLDDVVSGVQRPEVQRQLDLVALTTGLEVSGAPNKGQNSLD